MRTYRISPSLLNAFSGWLDSDDIYDKYWGESDAPAMTQDEFRAKQLAELLAYLNLEPQEPNEAADRGTALNDIIDNVQFGREVATQYQYCRDGYYEAHLNGWLFRFDKDLVESLCQVFQTGIPQFHIECSWRTSKGDTVILHGYPDYMFPTMIWDLKTTNKYDCEKYRDNWQRHVYPLAALMGGSMTVCETVTFYALECRKDRSSGIITAKPFTETYDVVLPEAEAKVREFVEFTVLPYLDEWQQRGLIPKQDIIKEE